MKILWELFFQNIFRMVVWFSNFKRIGSSSGFFIMKYLKKKKLNKKPNNSFKIQKIGIDKF